MKHPITLGNEDRLNNFDALRWVFAACVLLSHACIVRVGGVDADPLWKPLHGQVDLGALAVNGFFAISGYLITLSWNRTPEFGPYLRKRVLRIFPGWIVASLFCYFLVAPLGGARLSSMFTVRSLVMAATRIGLLCTPGSTAGAFAQQPLTVLNASMWTVRYEFLCYLLIPLILPLASRMKRPVVLVLFLVLLVSHAMQGTYRVYTPTLQIPLVGSLADWIRLATYFLGGMAVAQFRHVIPFRFGYALIAAAILAITGLGTGGFFMAMPTAGIYLLFYVAFERKLPLSGVAKHGDISYGLYLYGWPVEQLLRYYSGERLPAPAFFGVALVITLGLAALSWHLVERPWLLRKKLLTATHVPIEEFAMACKAGAGAST